MFKNNQINAALAIYNLLGKDSNSNIDMLKMQLHANDFTTGNFMKHDIKKSKKPINNVKTTSNLTTNNNNNNSNNNEYNDLFEVKNKNEDVKKNLFKNRETPKEIIPEVENK